MIKIIAIIMVVIVLSLSVASSASEPIPRFVELEYITIGFFDDNSRLEFRNTKSVGRDFGIEVWGFGDGDDGGFARTPTSDKITIGTIPQTDDEYVKEVFAHHMWGVGSSWLCFGVPFGIDFPADSTIFYFDVEGEGEITVKGKFVVGYGYGDSDSFPINITVTNEELEEDVEDGLSVPQEDDDEIQEEIQEEEIQEEEDDDDSNPNSGGGLMIVPVLASGGVMLLGFKSKKRLGL